MNWRPIAAFVVAAFFAADARALSGAGNPWETIDDAVCAGLVMQDYSAAIGARTEITAATRVAAEGDLPGHCRVAATIAPSIGVEVRMPITGWTQRFLFTGCGGLCGIINSAGGDDALKRGYAVATTDMGHRAGSTDDRSWTADKALVEDFNHRASHLTVALAKIVMTAYYGKGPDKTYSRGCSTGGRQGLTSALMYPEDFDGIIAGAPAADMATPHNAWSYLSNLDNSGRSVLDAAAISRVQEAVLAACDANDGVADGIVGDPLACNFDPRSLLCGMEYTASCLSAAQVAGVLRMYDGAKNSSGKPFYAMGYARGSEGGWAQSMVGEGDKPPGRAGSAKFFLDSVVGPTAMPSDFDFAKHGVKGGPLSARLDQGEDNTRLAPFAGRGGKILMYHGWSDVDVTPSVSLDFRRAAISGLGGDMVDSFLRLFFMPGMAHCRGGPGADTADFLSAIEAWVEHNVAPVALVTAKTMLPVRNYTDYPLGSDTVAFTRKAFPYPAVAAYSGTGSPDDATNWSEKR